MGMLRRLWSFGITADHGGYSAEDHPQSTGAWRRLPWVLGAAWLTGYVITPCPAWAGDGTFVDGSFVDGTPAVLNLSVFFEYDEPDPDSWLPAFNAASRLLYNATERQLQLGTVSRLPDCPGAKAAADVVISAGMEGARADVLGLGVTGRHVYLSQLHKSTSGSVRGQFGFVQQLATYVFGLRVEHDGVATRLPLPAGTSLTLPEEPFFCSQSTGVGASCLMDGGSTLPPHHTRLEFCTPSATGLPTAHNAGFALDLEEVRGRPYGVFVRTLQHTRHGQSAWETLEEVARDVYGVTMVPPTGLPVDDDTLHGDLVAGTTWVVEGCTTIVAAPQTVVFVLDRSGSMGGNPLDLAKLGTDQAVDAAPIGTHLGIVAFDTAASVLFPLQQIADDSTRAAAHAAIATIAAAGSTNITHGLQLALNEFTAGLRIKPELIVLLTDGAHNTGPAPATLLPTLVAEDIVVNAIGLGAGADLALLQDIADQTGGITAFAATPAELPDLLVDLSRTTGGTRDRVRTFGATIAAGAHVSEDVFIDALTPHIRVELRRPAGSLDLTVTRPDGTVVLPTDADVVIDTTPTLITSEITNAPTGLWALTVDATGAPTQDYDLQVVDLVGEVQVTPLVTPELVAFPEPVRIETIVVGDGPPVADANLVATIEGPGGATVVVPLFDDGSLAHGDTAPGDGVYANYFGQYAGNGVHTATVMTTNATGTPVPPMENGSSTPAATVVPFIRERILEFTVTGLPVNVGRGAGVVDRAPGSPPGRRITRRVLDEVMLAVRITASPEESVVIDQMTFRGSGTGDERSLEAVKLYVDGNRDGDIDAVGRFARPVGTAHYLRDDGVVVFDDLAFIPAGGSVDLLVVYAIDPELVPPVGAVMAARVPAPPSALAMLFCIPCALAACYGGRRSRRFAYLGALALVLCTGVYCGGGGGGGGGGARTDAPPPPPPPPDLPTFRVETIAGATVFRGLTSGVEIPAVGPAIQGNVFEVAGPV